MKAGDDTAKIIGTSTLNWDFTCIGCPGTFACEGSFLSGYQCGKVWFKEFVSAHESLYGQKPQADAWAIDIYPLDWVNTPNNDPTRLASYNGQQVLHSELAIQQLQGMRQYLNTVPEYVDTPLWVTEIGLHVGFDGWMYDPFPTRLVPVGNYHPDKLSNYIADILDWLETTGQTQKVEKWFFLASFLDLLNAGDGDMGITFFEGPDDGAPLTRIHRGRASG